MLQTQLKGSNTAPTPAAPSIEAPSRQQQHHHQQQNEYSESRRDNYNSSNSSSNEIRRGVRPPENDYHTSQQSYREARSGLDRERDRPPMSERPPLQPYRHDGPPPPIKYASSNGSSGPTSTAPPGSTSTSAPSKVDPIIRVKNFAPAASYKEIRTFLQGVQIEHDGIKLLHDANGQRTGQAFVRLIGIIDLKKALCRNKQFYEERQIEVSYMILL